MGRQMIRKKSVKLLLFLFPLLILDIANAKLYIVGTKFGAGSPAEDTPRFIDLGDGSDGEFNSSTYSKFGTISANKIIFNTDNKSVYNFTNFTLGDNYVIEPIGSQPLIIKSLQDVIIGANAGIRCSGNNGQNTQQAAGTTGGTGRCGGASGGNGILSAAGGNGSSGGTGTTGGDGGIAHAASPGGGGGGGGYSYQFIATTAERGFTGGVADAAAGTEDSGDLTLKTTLAYAGSGGGAGGAYTTVDGNEGSGGGGGGGGGVVIIYARRDVTLTAQTSFISVIGGNGGEGGDNVVRPGGTGKSGGGGSGAGGTIFIVAGNQVTSQTYGGIPESGFNADRGTAGSTAQNWSGGGGARGRIYIVDSDCDIDTANSCGDPDSAGAGSSVYLPVDIRNSTTWPNSEYGKTIYTEASELEFQAACGRMGNSWVDGLFFILILWLTAKLPLYAKRWRNIYSRA